MLLFRISEDVLCFGPIRTITEWGCQDWMGQMWLLSFPITFVTLVSCVHIHGGSLVTGEVHVFCMVVFARVNVAKLNMVKCHFSVY